MRVSRPSGVSNCTGVSRRTFLADVGMGFTGLALGAMLHRDGVARADASAGWAPPRRQAALRPEGQERHLAVHDRRDQPPGELRPQARAEQVRRQDDRRDAVQGRRSTRRYLKKNLREFVAGDCTTVQPQALPAAGRLQEARAERHRGQRLVAARRRLRRRHRRRPLDVDHRQRPRRPAPVPHRPARARRAVPDDRLVGPLRPRAR